MSEQNSSPEPTSSRGSKLHGIAVGGVIQAKRESKAKEDREASFKVFVSIIGTPVMYSVKVSRTHYDQLREGQHAQFMVSQTVFEGKIYNTAIYDN